MILVVVLCFFVTKKYSQVNLIPNPSFEDSLDIPNDLVEISKCKNWFGIVMTPDYYSVYSPVTPTNQNVSIPFNLTGFQNPKHGRFYVGFVNKIKNIFTNDPRVNIFEAIETQLPQKLIKDHIYDFSMFYSLADGSGIACNQLQAYFTVSQFSFYPTNIPLDPNFTYTNNLNFQVENDTTKFMTDTTNWISINGCFKADGGEEYLSIGNFRDGVLSKYIDVNRNQIFDYANNTFSVHAYYYIDDLSLYDLGYYSGSANCKNDSSVCFNAGVTIGNNLKDSSTYAWQPNIALSCTNCPNPIASPTVTTKYYLTKTLCGFVTKDSITVTVFTPTASATAGTSKTLCVSEFTQLGINDSTKFTTYVWQPSSYLSCSLCAMPLTKPLSNVTYTLQKMECNISSTSTVQILVRDCETTYTVPNIFTPNNDGVNEVWGILFNQVRDVKEFQLYIYNRWGNLIFEGLQPNIRWDGYNTSGIPCVDGVYFYVCVFKVKGEQRTLKGNITLIR